MKRIYMKRIALAVASAALTVVACGLVGLIWGHYARREEYLARKRYEETRRMYCITPVFHTARLESGKGAAPQARPLDEGN